MKTLLLSLILLSSSLVAQTLRAPFYIAPAAAPPAGGTVVTDDFNRTDYESLGSPNYVVETWSSGYALIIGNEAALKNVDVFSTVTFANNQYSQVVARNTTGLSIILRGQGGTGKTGYYINFEPGSNRIETHAWVAGVDTWLPSNVAFGTLALNDTCRAEIVGSTITIYVNSVLQNTVVDGSNLISSGHAGFGRNGEAWPCLDNWEGGDK